MGVGCASLPTYNMEVTEHETGKKQTRKLGFLGNPQETRGWNHY